MTETIMAPWQRGAYLGSTMTLLLRRPPVRWMPRAKQLFRRHWTAPCATLGAPSLSLRTGQSSYPLSATDACAVICKQRTVQSPEEVQ